MDSTLTGQQVVLQGTDAINLSDISAGGTAKHVKLSAGNYAVTLESSVHFHDQIAPLDQVCIFNTAPLKTEDAEKWYYTVSTTEGVVVTAKENCPIYVYLIDQVNSADNTGTATVTFTEIV